MDASQYKDIILGLVFLKYVSDAFEERRIQIAEELTQDGMTEDQIAMFIDDVDEYTGHGEFWVAENARWIYPNGAKPGTLQKRHQLMTQSLRGRTN